MFCSVKASGVWCTEPTCVLSVFFGKWTRTHARWVGACLVSCYRGCQHLHRFLLYFRIDYNKSPLNYNVFSRNTLLSVPCGNSRSWTPPCLRNSNRKYPPCLRIPSSKNSPLPLEFRKAIHGILLGIFWNCSILYPLSRAANIRRWSLNNVSQNLNRDWTWCPDKITTKENHFAD